MSGFHLGNLLHPPRRALLLLEHLSPFILQSDARLLCAFSPQEPRLGAPPLRRRAGAVDVDVTRVMDVPYNLGPRRARTSLGFQWEESLPGIFIWVGLSSTNSIHSIRQIQHEF